MDKTGLADLLRLSVNDFNQYREWYPDAVIDLEGVDLSQLKLCGINLRRAKLMGAVFSLCELDCASFDGADLRGCQFRYTSLTWASMRGADASCANFNGALLSHADMRETELSGTSFIDARFDHAFMSGAKVRNASFLHAHDLELAERSGVDWNEAEGVDATKLNQPALYLSEPILPVQQAKPEFESFDALRSMQLLVMVKRSGKIMIGDAENEMVFGPGDNLEELHDFCGDLYETCDFSSYKVEVIDTSPQVYPLN